MPGVFGQPVLGAAEPPPDPDAACAPCHRALSERYRKTPMANASGPASEGFLAADFLHPASGVHYRIAEEGGHVWLSYERGDPARPLEGRQELRYFLGSGRRGRTYLFEQEGYWFEAPINWYAKKQVWDMTPHYLETREMPLTLPVDPGCLHCHATGALPSLSDARNHYAGEPFETGGIHCASCHGDGGAHLASGGRVPMADIDRLEPVRRDSVCLNCHLEGQAVVARPGRRIEKFAPGENLFDYAVYFVYRGENGSGGRATSQWEALLRSQCRKASGERLTCTSCHDPHGSPAPLERVAFYRERCLRCHTGAGFAQRHFPENPDCTACHMARPASSDIAHEQVTDHWIRKRASEEQPPLVEGGDLVTVGGEAADTRDLGLAYAQIAARGDEAAGRRALRLLRQAETGATISREDHDLHTELGYLEQVGGEPEAAAREYGKALEIDPFDALAAGDLALLEVRRRNLPEAIRRWRGVVEHDPTQITAAMNLAVVECAEGQRDQAAEVLARLLLFSPDDQKARSFAEEIRTGHAGCRLR